MFDHRRLFSLFREGFLEIEMQGEILVHDGDKVLYQTNDAIGSFPARSLLKPFQFLATGLLEKKKVEPRFTACLGSISANHEQIAQIEKWYDDAELCRLVKKLKLPPSFPMDEKHRITLKALEEKPSVLFHTCFSKHMAILEGSLVRGWNLEHYNEVTHPYHSHLLEILSGLLGEDLRSVSSVADGCLLPSPVLNLAQMAKLYQKLGGAREGDSLLPIQKMMLEGPEWIGARGRADTKLMQANSAKLIAKEGADGLMGVSVLPNEKYPKGLGIIVKLLAGYQPNMALIALSPVLAALGLKEVHEVPRGHDIEFHFEVFKPRNLSLIDISPFLNESIAVWPGDQKFTRSVSLDTATGMHLTLSSINTTLHVGAHTDGPNHFENVVNGIGESAIDPYLGTAQVIEVKKSRGSTIVPSDIQTPILASRILFKTSSYPDPGKFNEDFVACSAELVEYLANKNVVLMGIDTPSIDPFSSKELPAHHATTKTGMRILEGIVLRGVDEGLYSLSAIPLRIAMGDASPVRAVLERQSQKH